MFNHIDIISIPVTDQTVAKQFYVDMLGFQVIRENPMGPDRMWVELSIPDAQTSITLVTWIDSMPAGSVQGLVVSTNDIDGTHAELTKKGVDMSALEDQPWGRFTTFSDPDGNGWVVHQAI